MKKIFLKLHILQEKTLNVFIFCLNIKFKQEISTEGKVVFFLILLSCVICANILYKWKFKDG